MTNFYEIHSEEHHYVCPNLIGTQSGFGRRWTKGNVRALFSMSMQLVSNN